MVLEAEQHISKISRYLYSYAGIIVFGLIWNFADGEIENLRDFIRGGVRVIVMIYLSRSIWELKSVNWWATVVFCLVFATLGAVGSLIGLYGGLVLHNIQLLKIAVVVIPSTYLLGMVFYLSVKKEVREQFVN